MNPELLQLLLEILRSQQTTGFAATGGDTPYDDYDTEHTIGGIGAATPESFGDYADGSIEGLNANPTMYDTSPSTVGFYGPQAQMEQQRSLAELLAAMQQGVNADSAYPGLNGLFGSVPTIERPKPKPQVTPVAAPVAGNVSAPPSGTPTPDPQSDISTLPNRGDSVKKPAPARTVPKIPERQNTAKTPPRSPGPGQPSPRASDRARLATQKILSQAQGPHYGNTPPVYQGPQPAYRPRPVYQNTQPTYQGPQPTFQPAPQATAQSHNLAMSRPSSSLGTALAKLKR